MPGESGWGNSEFVFEEQTSVAVGETSIPEEEASELLDRPDLDQNLAGEIQNFYLKSKHQVQWEKHRSWIGNITESLSQSFWTRQICVFGFHSAISHFHNDIC